MSNGRVVDEEDLDNSENGSESSSGDMLDNTVVDNTDSPSDEMPTSLEDELDQVQAGGSAGLSVRNSENINTDLLGSNSRILTLQREVYQQRLQIALAQNERLKYENEILQLKQHIENAKATNPAMNSIGSSGTVPPPTVCFTTAVAVPTTNNSETASLSSRFAGFSPSEIVTTTTTTHSETSSLSSRFASYSQSEIANTPAISTSISTNSFLCQATASISRDNIVVSAPSAAPTLSSRAAPSETRFIITGLGPAVTATTETRSHVTTARSSGIASSNPRFIVTGLGPSVTATPETRFHVNSLGQGITAQQLMSSRTIWNRPSDAAFSIAGPSQASMGRQTDNRGYALSGSVDGRNDTRRTHELPPFSGRPEEWPFFSSTYYSTTEAYAYTDLENLLRLRKSLTGEALKTAEPMLIYPRHVGQVMETLETTFGRPALLVRSQVNIVRNLPNIYESHLEQIGPFAMSVRNLAIFLDSDATRQYLADPILLDELLVKLPMSRRLDWAAASLHILPSPTIKDFADWLTGIAKLVNLCSTNPTSSRTVNRPSAESSNRRTPYTKNQHVLLSQTEKSPKCNLACAFCAKAHDIRGCEEFLRLPTQDRWNEVSKRPLCYCCLRPDHLLPACSDKVKCGVDGCPKWHSPILHATTAPKTFHKKRLPRRSNGGERNQDAVTVESSPTDRKLTSTNATEPAVRFKSSSTVLSCHDDEPKGTILFRVVPVTLYGPTSKIQTLALLDDGASVTLIDEELAEKLQLEGESSELSLKWFGSKSTREKSRKVSVEISSINNNSDRFEVRYARTIRNLKLPTQSLNRKNLLEKNPHLRDLPFSSYSNGVPKILIGLDHLHLGIPEEVRLNPHRNGIVATRTKLGWVVYGGDREYNPTGATVLHIDDEDTRYEELNELMRAHFSTEDFGVKIVDRIMESDADIRARAILAATSKRVGSRFETGLLWRNDTVLLPNSLQMALIRLRGIETKMKRNAEFADLYRGQINAYVEKGYARKLTTEETERRTKRTWYLPHFATQNVNKPGKMRLVFDAAATVGGVSLNSALIPGPDINVPLIRILFQFRLGKVGVCADIREMFHQVLIRKDDQDSQRFLWRDGDSTVEPSTYVMQVMVFGATCSPTSAQYIKNINAAEFEAEMPEAADAIRRRHYVDDFVTSFESAADAIRITKDVVELHRRGGFDLRGIVTNNIEVRQNFGSTGSEGGPISMEPDEATAKILGMSWDTSDDMFRFLTRFPRVDPNIADGSRRPTKREMLSVAMSIFDPFGLLANFTLVAKVILQDIWRLGIGWDEIIPDNINQRWQNWRKQIELTQLVRVPRCYSKNISSATKLELHVFADASETGFAAVAYWRIVTSGGVEISFVAGKSRCAPLKLLSIPRLELQAAILATRLMVEIKEAHELPIRRTVLWSDSETVLKWIRSDQRKYKPFVAFRIAEITESAPASWWRWVPTAQNVADEATRCDTTSIFDPESRWIRGPAWLLEDESTWPQSFQITDDDKNDDEIRSKFVGLITTEDSINFERFSKFLRLVRATAYVSRFIQNSKQKKPFRTSGELGAMEINAAIDMLCKIVQKEAYPDEVAALSSQHDIERSSPIFGLKPYLDSSGLLRVHGRTDAASDEHLGRDAKRPILLPHRHRFTMLVTKHYHEENAHQLTDATIAAVRYRYWVPSLRSLVKQVTHACNFCRLRKAKPAIPSQGQLPRERLLPYARPFTHTGLDYFGPITVTIGRRQEKRWVALFTCLSMRAVHLELAHDLSADACILAIRNFCCLRGVPAMIRCDNGTNFVGAKKEMNSCLNFLASDQISQHLASKCIEWRFNCPANPEAGGAWERLVQSVKRVLRVTLHEEAPRVETIRTLLNEAANIVNSRPLTHLETDPEDVEPITPNHFLIGGPNAIIIPNPADIEPRATRKQWQICRALSRRFWTQWVRDYLPELTKRTKHYADQTPLAVGDLVYICDENLPRCQWVRGRITAVVTGPDGVVRTATILTSHGTSLQRPATKLAKLDVGPLPPICGQSTGSGVSPT